MFFITHKDRSEATDHLLGQRCLDHGTTDTLPAPGDPHHFIVFGRAGTPESSKSNSHPSAERDDNGRTMVSQMSGMGQLLRSTSCCGYPMEQASTDADPDEAVWKKHQLAAIASEGNGIVKVGAVGHPMKKDHYIEWVEIISTCGAHHRRFLKPGDEPESRFLPPAEHVYPSRLLQQTGTMDEKLQPGSTSSCFPGKRQRHGTHDLVRQSARPRVCAMRSHTKEKENG